MPRYRYTALAQNGSRSHGVIEAFDTAAVVRALAAKGLTAISVNPARVWWRPQAGAGGQVSRAGLSGFLIDLAAMQDAGAPVRKSLDVLAGPNADKATRTLAELMRARLDAGADLGEAAKLETSGDVAFAAALVGAGERSGRLSETLRFAAELITRQDVFARELAGALAYPAFLLGLALTAIVALSAFAGPALAPIIDEGGSAALKLVVAAGGVLQERWRAIALGVAGFVVSAWSAARSHGGRELISRLSLNAPIAGAITRDLNFGAFARILGALLTGGVPAAQAFAIAASAPANLAVQERAKRAAAALQTGMTASSALATLDAAPGEIARLARVGEEAGALGEMLVRAGDLLIERAMRRMTRVSAIAGPALILVMGGLVAWLLTTFLSGLAALGDGVL